MKFNDIIKEVLDNNKRDSFKEAVDTGEIKQILIKKTQKSSQEVDKMIKDYYDLAIRRGANSVNEIANEIRNFWLHTSSESFKEAIEKLVFVDNETAKEAEDILKKYPSATRVKCVRMQRTLLFDNVKDKETAKAQLIDNGMNGLSKQSLSSENFKEAASYIDTAEGRAKFIKTEVEDKDGKWNDNYQTKDGYYLIHQGDKHHVYKVESFKKESISKESVLKEGINPEFEKILKDLNAKYNDNTKYGVTLYVDDNAKKVEVSIASVGSQTPQEAENRIKGIQKIINEAKEFQKRFDKQGWKSWD